MDAHHRPRPAHGQRCELRQRDHLVLLLRDAQQRHALAREEAAIELEQGGAGAVGKTFEVQFGELPPWIAALAIGEALAARQPQPKVKSA